MHNNSIGVIAVLIVVVAGGWYLLSGTPAKAPTTETPVTNQMPIIDGMAPEMIVENNDSSVTVTYTDQGFSPKSVTVPIGTTVTFINQSSEGMWVASGPHPTHTLYSGTSLTQHCPDTTNSAFDECTTATPGSSFSFTFNKEGVWKYHDHTDASQTGSVTVTASASAATAI